MGKLLRLYNTSRYVIFISMFVVMNFGISTANNIETGENDKDLVFVTTTFPPFTIHANPDIDNPGFINEIVKEAFENQGYNATIKIYPWVRAQKMAKSGAVTGTFNSTKTKEYEDAFLYSEPFSHLAAAYFTKKDYNGPPLSTLESAKGLKISANLGYSLSRLLTNAGMDHVTVRDEISGLRLMLGGRVDAYLAYKRPVFWNQASFGERIHDEQIRFHQIRTFPYYLIISKKHANAQKLIHLFDEAIENMTRDGRLSGIMNNYLGKFMPIN